MPLPLNVTSSPHFSSGKCKWKPHKMLVCTRQNNRSQGWQLRMCLGRKTIGTRMRFWWKWKMLLEKKLVKGCLAIANQFKYIFVRWHLRSPSYYIYPRKMKIFHAEISITMSSMASIVIVSNRNCLGVKKKMERRMLICTFIGMFKNTKEETE